MTMSALRWLTVLPLAVVPVAILAVAGLSASKAEEPPSGKVRSGWATDTRAKVRAPIKAIQCGQLLDVRERKVWKNVTILIDGERIIAIRRGGVSPPNADAVIDLRDHVCAPGLMDMHLHLTSSFIRRGETDRPQDPFDYTVSELAIGLTHARETLYSGVTTIRSTGEFLPHRASVYMNEAIDKWEVLGPRIFLASHHIGYDYARRFVVEASNANLFHETRISNGISYDPTEPGGDVRQAVRDATSHGEDWVKVSVDVGGPLGRMKNVRLWSFEELKAMADEAHKRGRKITGHIEMDEAARDAVLAGFDCVEHVFIPSRQTLDLMKQRHVYWSTTLVDFGPAHDRTDPLLGAATLERSKDLTEETASRDAAFRYAYSIGVPMVYASDGIFNPGNNRGRMVLEFSEYLDLGVTFWDLLSIATLNPAAMLGQSDNLGSIDPDKYADIIALPQNPLDDITAFNRVDFVMKGGNVVRDDLHRSPLPDVFAMQLPDVTYVRKDGRIVCSGRDC
jgi:imidazolonepropionase-like amidohydrolase